LSRDESLNSRIQPGFAIGTLTKLPSRSADDNAAGTAVKVFVTRENVTAINTR